MIDLYRGKLCCAGCHHLIDMDREAKATCPYCGKRLTREEAEYWRKEEEAKELRKKDFGWKTVVLPTSWTEDDSSDS